MILSNRTYFQSQMHIFTYFFHKRHRRLPRHQLIWQGTVIAEYTTSDVSFLKIELEPGVIMNHQSQGNTCLNIFKSISDLGHVEDIVVGMMGDAEDVTDCNNEQEPNHADKTYPQKSPNH